MDTVAFKLLPNGPSLSPNGLATATLSQQCDILNYGRLTTTTLLLLPLPLSVLPAAIGPVLVRAHAEPPLRSVPLEESQS